MTDINIDVSKLPEDVREKLAELDLELSEGGSAFSCKNSILIDKLRLFYAGNGWFRSTFIYLQPGKPWRLFWKSDQLFTFAISTALLSAWLELDSTE